MAAKIGNREGNGLMRKSQKTALKWIMGASYVSSGLCVCGAAFLPVAIAAMGIFTITILAIVSGAFFLAGTVCAGVLLSNYFKEKNKNKKKLKESGRSTGQIHNTRRRDCNISKIRSAKDYSSSYRRYGLSSKSINSDNSVNNYTETDSNRRGFGRKGSRRNSINSTIEKEISLSSLKQFDSKKRPSSSIPRKKIINNIKKNLPKLKKSNNQTTLAKNSIKNLNSSILKNNNKRNITTTKAEARNLKRSKNQNTLLKKSVNKTNFSSKYSKMSKNNSLNNIFIQR